MKNRTTRTHIARRKSPASPDGGARLPHERDEAADAGGEPRKEIAIAERDVRQGQVDTDNYTRCARWGEAGLRKRRQRSSSAAPPRARSRIDRIDRLP